MNQSSTDLLTLFGKVTRIVFNRPDNGYTVMQVEDQNHHKNKVVVVGHFFETFLGELVHFEGTWQQHPTHGQQFFAKTATREMPIATEEKFLIHQIDGVGPSFAQKLQRAFGDDLKEILDKSPQRLKEVSGIGAERYKRIMESWGKHQLSHDSMLFLTSAGVGYSMANRIYKHYAENTIDKITTNPYRLLEEMTGIGFQTAENIAKGLHIPNNDSRRLRAGIMQVMQQETRFGHCGMTQDKLLQQSASLLKVSREELIEEMNGLAAENKIIPETLKSITCFFMPQLWRQEQLISQKIKVFLARTADDTHDLVRTLKELEKSLTLSKEQYQALEQALYSPVFVLTGGPGVGKTTSVNTLVEIFKKNHLKIALAAPTGRAAKRLQEATQSPAKTIHRLLEYDSFTEKFNFGKYQVLPIDVLIIDDIHFWAGKEKTQDVFFHIFNHLHQNNKQIILTSDKAPVDLSGIEQRLLSRFKWGLSADLQSPDLETRIAILRKKMYIDGIELPTDIVEYIAYSIQSNVRELEGALISIMAQTSLNKKPITLELAKQMPNVNFLWVGGTPELVAFWKNKLTEVGMTNVTMTGFVQHERIPLYQAAADVLLMPYSRSIEASSGQDIAEVINPMKMFEYMASGRAIISADLPSIREVLNDGNAVLCEPAEIEKWKVAIESLLADEPRRLALGKQARIDVSQLTWLKREERIMDLLRSNIRSH